MIGVPGRPPAWGGPLVEIARAEWRLADRVDPADVLGAVLRQAGLDGPLGAQAGDLGVALLLGAAGCAALAGLAGGPPTPAPDVPDLVAVAVRREPVEAGPAVVTGAEVGDWETTWTDDEHAQAVQDVRQAIARGDVYQANVVGHRSAAYDGDPRALAAAVASLPGAAYGGVLSGTDWTVACASPEQLVRVAGDRVTTRPVKGTWPVEPGGDLALRASSKDRAEHVMIVDLARNDLSQVAVTGTVEVEQLYELSDWSGLWQAGSTVSARLAPERTTLDVLRALAPGGSVTGAPKRAACSLLADLEPCGRGPSMGVLGFLWPGGLDLGLTIRTVAVDRERVHLWAGGGITWGSDPAAEVREAHAKAAPILRALAQVRPSSS